MTRPAESPARLASRLGAVGVWALLALTVASPGATRMHAWPWTLVYALVLAAPVGVLLLRLLDRRSPLVLPGPSWCVAALAAAAAVLASALASPYRGPSLLWSAPLLSALACFFAVFDRLHSAPDPAGAVPARGLRTLGFGSLAIALVSLGLWLASLPGQSASEIFAARNPYPLGHSNYTAGLALLLLPGFAVLAARGAGAARLAWAGAGLLPLVLLFTSGSRGGLLGLGALLLGALLAAPWGVRRKLGLAGLAVVAALAFAWANPRTREVFTRPAPAAEPNLSNVQRAAMAQAGARMGWARPLLGWGPGTTPLVYPRFRHQLEGGADTVLQLHSLPVQLWAELGAAGLAGGLALVLLAGRQARRCPPAAVALGGYAVFALTDYQLDVPVFAGALAVCAALLAPPAAPETPARPAALLRRALGLVALAALAGLALLGRPDPTPALNLRALALARDPAQAAAAGALFRQSLALNPDQELAHFNLGWLQVVRDPADAEAHFLAAARLVPDKGGVYFGLGLARLNQGRRDDAVRAFALECLNDPVFLVSPWWRQPALAALQSEVRAQTARGLAAVPAGGREAAYLAALLPWLDGTAGAGELLGAAHTAERVGYFSRRPARPDFAAAPVRLYRRERSGYPVLMRDLDLPVPVDLFDVQENTLATGPFRFLFPRKGWLPGPALLRLLATPPP